MNVPELIPWKDLESMLDNEIDYYRNLYENPKTVSKEKAFEYVCKLQALKKLKQRIIGVAEEERIPAAEL